MEPTDQAAQLRELEDWRERALPLLNRARAMAGVLGEWLALVAMARLDREVGTPLGALHPRPENLALSLYTDISTFIAEESRP